MRADDAGKPEDRRASTGPLPPVGSAAKTSRPARSAFSRTALSSAAWSTTSAREVLTKTAPGFIAAKNSSSTRLLVSGFKAT